MSAFELREYQTECLDSIQRALLGQKRGTGAGIATRIAAVLPTGMGKTVIFAELARSWPLGRVLILVHRDELAEQAYRKVHSADPSLRVGIVKAERNDVDADVIVGSVQTLRNPKRLAQLRNVGLVIVDECFPAGTLVGGRAIEAIRVGDYVPSWDEATGKVVQRHVTGVMSKRPTAMVRVTLEDGGTIECTPNHPILTTRGWCPAARLRGELVVSSTHHDYANRNDLHAVRHGNNDHHEVTPGLVRSRRPGLLPGRLSGRLGEGAQLDHDGGHEPALRLQADAGTQPHARSAGARADVGDTAGDRSPARRSWWQRLIHPRAATHPGGVFRVADGSLDRAWRRAASLSLQGRYRTSVDDGLRRGGRGIPFLAGTPRIGRTQGRQTEITRVADVQVLESGRDGTYGGVCPDGLVYNLEVETTHTYLIGNGVVVHNCHHANAASYVTVMTELGCYGNPGTPCVGFTATLVRADKLKPGDVWQEVVYTKDIVWGIRNGYLVDVKGKRIQVKNLDLSRVRRLAGDLQADAVAAELLDAEAPEQIAAAYVEHASDRLGVVFWPNVAASEAGCEAFQAAGIESASIYGTTPKDERETAYAAHAAGDIQVLHNVNVLTEGWDQPPVSCVVPARLTQSAGLYMQMIGRGTRPSPGKHDLLVLDPVGVTGRHKLATLADTSMTLHGVEDDETLTEAADRAEREALLEEALALGVDPTSELLALEVEQARREQERVAKEVSLFAERAAVWLQTPHGVWFIPVKDWFLFLWPEGHGLFQVGTCRISGKDETPFQNSRVLASGLLQDGAMAYAEKLAKQADPAGHTERTAAWRRSSRPTAGRARFARSLGIRVAQTMTDADVADAIHVKLAARSLGG